MHVNACLLRHSWPPLQPLPQRQPQDCATVSDAPAAYRRPNAPVPQARWPSGLRRCVKVIPTPRSASRSTASISAVFGRGFESHSRQQGSPFLSLLFWPSAGALGPGGAWGVVG